MIKSDTTAKLTAAAQLIDGRLLEDKRPVAFCIKGSVLGFPATLEAINTSWPFGVTYYLETKVIVDPNKQVDANALKMTITPRVATGLFGFLAQLFVLQARGMSVGDKHFDSRFIVSYNDRMLAEKFAKYPGVWESLVKLEQFCKFSEVHIVSDAGVSISQPHSFKSLDLDICRETFRILGELGQVLFESF